MNAQKAGMAFLSCLVVGCGLGLVFGNVEVGGGIGLGLGCAAVALFRGKKKDVGE